MNQKIVKIDRTNVLIRVILGIEQTYFLGCGMEVRNSLGRSVRQLRRDYDAACKSILAERQVRARVLGAYVGELGDLRVAEIERMLDDEVEMGEPVGRDERGLGAGRAHDINAEDPTLEEGTARFDVRFAVTVPRGEAVVEVNLEAQNKWSVGYPLPSRAVFYCARMVSA